MHSTHHCNAEDKRRELSEMDHYAQFVDVVLFIYPSTVTVVCFVWIWTDVVST